MSADLVRRRLALLDLIPDIQQQIRAGSLPLGHAEAMAGLDRNNQIAQLSREEGKRTRVTRNVYLCPLEKLDELDEGQDRQRHRHIS